MAKKFPKTLYVKAEGDTGEEYFVADGALYGLAEMGSKIKIGVYELKETIAAEVVVKTTKD